MKRHSNTAFLNALRAVLRLEPLYVESAPEIDQSLWTDEAAGRKPPPAPPRHWAREEWTATGARRKRREHPAVVQKIPSCSRLPL